MILAGAGSAKALAEPSPGDELSTDGDAPALSDESGEIPDDGALHPPIFSVGGTDALLAGDGKPVPQSPAPRASNATSALRVQIFPHIGRYATPQGRERNIQVATLKSPGSCRLWPAHDDPGGGPIKSGAPLDTGSSFKFTTKKLTQPRWVECDQPVTVVRGPGVHNYLYTGGFHVSRRTTDGGKAYVRVVNVLPMEEYLRGVIPSEMESNWHAEALKVQAVAARSYAYYQVFNPPPAIAGQNIDMDDTVLFQAYLGKSRWTDATDAAATATAGQVITFSRVVALTHFSDDSGGFTEDARVAFNEDIPYERGRAEPYDPKLFPSTSWSPQLNASEVTSDLADAGLIPGGASVISLTIPDNQRDPSGRAINVTVGLDSGATRSVPATSLQFAVHLRSTLFGITTHVKHAQVTVGHGKKKRRVDRVITSFSFDGKGFGHGVGMAQRGAQAIASSLGWGYTRILGSYYPGTELCHLDAGLGAAGLTGCGPLHE